jgi:hypothetical protein
MWCIKKELQFKNYVPFNDRHLSLLISFKSYFWQGRAAQGEGKQVAN